VACATAHFSFLAYTLLKLFARKEQTEEKLKRPTLPFAGLGELLDTELIVSRESCTTVSKLPSFLSAWIEHCLEQEGIVYRRTESRSGAVSLSLAAEQCTRQFTLVSVAESVAPHAVALYRHLRNRHPWPSDADASGDFWTEQRSTR